MDEPTTAGHPEADTVIRPYRETDTDAIVEVWYAASVVATPFLSEEFLNGERDNIRNIWLHRAETWVFEQAGEVVGFLSLLGNEVGAIFVHPDAQRKGIGRALLNHAGTLHDQLYLDVFEENAIGRRFYEKYGFRFEREHMHEESGHRQLRLHYSLEPRGTRERGKRFHRRG